MIRILIATHSLLVGDAVRTVLERRRDLDIAGCVSTRSEIEQLVAGCHVLLITQHLQNVNVLELIGDLHAAHPDLKILLIADREEARVIVRYLEAGAAGYILDAEPVHSVVKKVRGAYKAQAFIAPHVTGELIARVSQLANEPDDANLLRTKAPRLATLTPREREVIALLACSYSNRQIGDQLFISPGTAKNHVHRILRKLQVSSRGAAADIYRLHELEHGAADGSAPLRL